MFVIFFLSFSLHSFLCEWKMWKHWNCMFSLFFFLLLLFQIPSKKKKKSNISHGKWKNKVCWGLFFWGGFKLNVWSGDLRWSDVRFTPSVNVWGERERVKEWRSCLYKLYIFLVVESKVSPIGNVLIPFYMFSNITPWCFFHCCKW